MLKLIHQFQPEVLFQDDYLQWFFEDRTVASLSNKSIDFSTPQNDAEEFERVVYWYVVLREKYGDEAIESAIQSGCQQVLLLGAGYDTRFFRLPIIQERSIPVVEVDLPALIKDKQSTLIQQLGHLPQELNLTALDFNQDRLELLFQRGLDPALPSVVVWQGVSYYLPQAKVEAVLTFVNRMAAGSVLVFDACSPLMTFKNDRVPGIASNINKLHEIGEPYLFGLESRKMELWLQEMGFELVELLQQNDLEAKYLHRRSLLDEMWYIVTVKVP